MYDRQTTDSKPVMVNFIKSIEYLLITLQMNKDTGIIKFARETTEDVFILHNTKDMEITSADYLPEIG